MKIRRIGADFFQADRTDGQTYMTKLIIAFRNFANAPNNKYLTYSKGTKGFRKGYDVALLRVQFPTFLTNRSDIIFRVK
jgi:hypothetical protein